MRQQIEAWHGLRIGESTYQDFKESFYFEEIIWSIKGGHLVFTNPHSLEDVDWTGGGLSACFKGSILSAVSIYYYPREKGEFPLNLQGFIQKFGNPDKVTWSFNYYSRSVIWAEEGILIDVTPENLDEIQVDNLSTWKAVSVTLFPPVREESLVSSQIVQSILDPKVRDPNFPSDKPRGLGIEDPWGFNEP